MQENTFEPANFLAIKILEKVGVAEPSEQAINVLEAALSHAVIKSNVIYDYRLKMKERACLFWAAKGKTIKETAEIMNSESSEIEACRKTIKRKLRASSIAQAVFEGIRFGYIQKEGRE